MNRLGGRVCVVAGVAGVLGEAVARRFADEGGIVVGIDRREHAAGDLSVVADFSEEGQVRDVYARVWDAYGRLDVIHNNAGLTDPADGSALDVGMDAWNRVLTANLSTAWLSCKYGAPLMLRTEPTKGSIINTASFLAGMGSATAQAAFNVAKAGVEQLSRDLGVHLARRGVRVNALSLGPIETPHLQELFGRIGPAESERRFARMPMGRFGTVEEFAASAAYLASDDSGFVTGCSFPLNGGVQGAYTTPTG